MTPAACLVAVCLVAPHAPPPKPVEFTIVPEPTILHLESICADYTKAQLHREGLFEWVDCI